MTTYILKMFWSLCHSTSERIYSIIKISRYRHTSNLAIKTLNFPFHIWNHTLRIYWNALKCYVCRVIPSFRTELVISIRESLQNVMRIQYNMLQSDWHGQTVVAIAGGHSFEMEHQRVPHTINALNNKLCTHLYCWIIFCSV